MNPPAGRKIVHVDMDAFYAAVEQRDRPELRGKPVIVGGDPDRRGVVATCSYEARTFGIHSAMSSWQARSRCPHAVFLKPDFSKYRSVSRQIHGIFSEVSDLVEPLSLDEAYMDVTVNKLNEPLARNVAKIVKQRILEETGLTASAGVGPNKFIAKIASDLRKPDGLVVIPPARVEAFVAELPIEKFWGVGPARAKRLHALGISQGKDVRALGREELALKLGGFGEDLFHLAHGIDGRKVTPHRARKSYGTEITFDQDVTDLEILTERLGHQAREISQALEEKKLKGRTFTVKIRYDNFDTITRSQTNEEATQDREVVFQVCRQLLKKTEAGRRPVRLIGVTMSGFGGKRGPYQLYLDPSWVA